MSLKLIQLEAAGHGPPAPLVCCPALVTSFTSKEESELSSGWVCILTIAGQDHPVNATPHDLLDMLRRGAPEQWTSVVQLPLQIKEITLCVRLDSVMFGQGKGSNEMHALMVNAEGATCHLRLADSAEEILAKLETVGAEVLV